MSEFKVGDLVKCIWAGLHLTEGNVYKVLDVIDNCNTGTIDTVRVKNDCGADIEYFSTRFELYTIPKDPLVTIRQSEYDDLISEINALQELVKELSAPQDTALEQQARTYRALNDKLISHESFQEGEDGESTTRCEELLNTVDFLHEIYAEWKTKDYETSVASAGSDAFKPISEYTLEDWKQACAEDWEFECRNGYPVQVVEVNRTLKYPVECTDGLCRDIKGFWGSDTVDEDDIVKRIQ